MAKHSARDRDFRKLRAVVLRRNKAENGGLCVWCGQRPASVGDHVPPLGFFADPEQWSGEVVASCRPCSDAQGGKVKAMRDAARKRARRNAEQAERYPGRRQL